MPDGRATSNSVRICTRCGFEIKDDRYTLAPHVWPYRGPMHWPTSLCPKPGGSRRV